MSNYINFKGLFPFCVYELVDTDKNIYKSQIRLINKKITDNKLVFGCEKIRDWNFVDRFYGIKPIIIPRIPGLKIFCIYQRKEYPFGIVYIKQIYDIFQEFSTDEIEFTSNIYDKIFFSAWAVPVPNSSPLYFNFLGNNNIYISSQNRFNVKNIKVYLLSATNFPGDFRDIKFECKGNIIYPYKNEVDKYIFNPDQSSTKIGSFLELINNCQKTQTRAPHDLEYQIKSLSRRKNKSNNLVILLLLSLSIIVLVIIFWLYKKTFN